MSEPASGKKSSNRKIAIVIAVVVIVIIVGVVAYYLYNSVGIGKPSQVTLTGLVTTTGADTRPEKITFTSVTTGYTYVADVSGGGNPANCSITLPNGDSYTVTITWVNTIFGSIGGNADAGTLNLNTRQSSITEDWAG
jgi:flagellar basal body-associated protein FliL